MDFAPQGFVDFVQKLGLFLGRELVSLCSLFSLSFRRIGSYLVYCDPPQVSRATLILIYVFVQILSVCKLYWSKRKRKC